METTKGAEPKHYHMAGKGGCPHPSCVETTGSPSALVKIAPAPAATDTLEQARAYVESRAEMGVKCPCCGGHYKRYTRPLDSGIARGLIALVRASPKGEIVHVKDIPPLLIGSQSWTAHDFAKARFWGLCEEVPPKELPKELIEKAAAKRRRVGFWRSTEKGRQFVFSLIKVPSHIILENNKFKGFREEKLISISDALGEHFDYYKLVGGAPPKE
jgi:hypothetical protein